jgi:hypothetical protein
MRLFLAAAVAALILAGCHSSVRTSPAVDSDYSAPRGESSDVRLRGTTATVPSQANVDLEAVMEDAELRIQRAGRITLDVKDQMTFSGELRKNAASFDAIVMAFSDRAVTYRMPSAKLEALLKWLGEQDPKLVELDSFDFSALDRTGEFFSVDARLEAVKAARARTMELLKIAKDLAEIERIEAKLEAQQTRIDGYETALFDIKLRAGRVEVRIQME